MLGKNKNNYIFAAVHLTVFPFSAIMFLTIDLQIVSAIMKKVTRIIFIHIGSSLRNKAFQVNIHAGMANSVWLGLKDETMYGDLLYMASLFFL